MTNLCGRCERDAARSEQLTQINTSQERTERGVANAARYQEEQNRVSNTSGGTRLATAIKSYGDASTEYKNLKEDGGTKEEKRAARQHLDAIKKLRDTEVENIYAPKGSSRFLKNTAKRIQGQLDSGDYK